MQATNYLQSCWLQISYHKVWNTGSGFREVSTIGMEKIVEKIMKFLTTEFDQLRCSRFSKSWS